MAEPKPNWRLLTVGLHLFLTQTHLMDLRILLLTIDNRRYGDTWVLCFDLSTFGNIDLVYEATGASNLAVEMMKYIGTNGIFIFTGGPPRKRPIEAATDLMRRNLVLKNQVVFGTVNAGRNSQH
jgi:threonine dehydrogenase-like Zn-dependent dehydrogenase